jgi:hypothetical protein
LRITRTPPAVVAYGEKEAPYIKGSRQFVDALKAKGGTATLVPLSGMGHDQTALTLGDRGSALTQAVISLVAARR